MDSAEFEHFHRQAIARLKETIKEVPTGPAPTESEAAAVVRQECEASLSEAVNKLSGDATPEGAFELGLKALAKVDDLRFLIENLVEAVKRGESLQDSLMNYQYAGILTRQFSLAPDVHNSPFQSNALAGGFLRRVWKWLKKVAFTLMEIVTNALKSSAKWFAIKPNPTIGLAGAFPTFGLTFALEGKAVTFYELFHQLTGIDP